MKVSIKHRLEYGCFRLLVFAQGLVPEVLAYGFVAVLGQIYFMCSRRRQRFALKFLRQAYPEGKTDRELLTLGRKSMGNIMKVVIDMIRVPGVLRRGTFFETLDGEDELVEALGDEPAILVSGHLGSWEIGAICAALVTEESHVIGRRFKNPLLQEHLEESRRFAGLHLHPRRGGIRGLARALKNGAFVIQAVDQNQRLRGLFVPFFGKVASTDRAAASLAVRERRPIIVCSCIRTGRGFRFRYRVHRILRPRSPVDRGDVARAVEELVEQTNRCLEDVILTYPDQYLWVHDRYRTQPDPSEADTNRAGAQCAGSEAS